MTDRGLAALATALHEHGTMGSPTVAMDSECLREAAAILAALHEAGWALTKTPKLEGVEWVPIEAVDLARLRKIEEAARALCRAFPESISWTTDPDGDCFICADIATDDPDHDEGCEAAILRAALKDQP